MGATRDKHLVNSAEAFVQHKPFQHRNLLS